MARGTPGSLLGKGTWTPARVAGALLGVAGGEAWRGARGGFENGGPVTATLLELSRSYTSPGAGGCRTVPAHEIARRHQGTGGPGWLLPIAVAARRRDLAAEASSLATAARATPEARDLAVVYVTLAAELLSARPVDQAIEVASRALPSVPAEWSDHQASRDRWTGPPLSGSAPVDAVTVGLWALRQPGDTLSSLAPSLAWWCGPEVAAAAAGLLGLRDGCEAVPAQWHRGLPVAQECRDLAPALVDARPADIDLVEEASSPAEDGAGAAARRHPADSQ